MDPFSVAAGITGTVAVGLHTAHRISQLLDGIKDAPDDVRAATRDIKALSGVLSTLEKYSADRIITRDAASLLLNSIENCNSAMEKFREKVSPYTKAVGDGNMTKWKSFKWAFDKGDIRLFKERLQRSQDELTLCVHMVNT